MNNWETELKAGLDKIGLAYTEAQIAQLMKFAGLLQRWNKVYNLTAIRDEREILTHHLLDSATLVPYVASIAPDAKAVLDVGSGGGLPSIPLAILRPDLKVTAVDAVKKKTAFLTQAAIDLGLRNYRAEHKRVETMKGAYDVITSRAFASLELFTELTYKLVGENGVWIAMKGQNPEKEMTSLPHANVVETIVLDVPGLDEDRHLVVMKPVD